MNGVKSLERDGWMGIGSVSGATRKPLVAERMAWAMEVINAGTARWLGLRRPRPP